MSTRFFSFSTENFPTISFFTHKNRHQQISLPLSTPVLLFSRKSIFISALTDEAKQCRSYRKGDWLGMVFCCCVQSAISLMK